MATNGYRRTSKPIGDIPLTSEQAAVITAIKKNKGVNTVVTGSEVRQPFRIRTNAFTLDYALLGGIPYNRTTMIHGKKHGGKTTLAKRIVASIQQSRPDQIPVWVDAEDTYDATWASKQGVDNYRVQVLKPDTGEDAVDMTVALIHARETSLVVVDSLAGLLPYKEEEGSAEDEAIPGLQAKLITRMLRRATGALMKERKRDHFVTLLVLNQHRVKIGGWSPTGEARTLPGGAALGHFTSCEILVKNKENVDKSSGLLKDNEHAFTIEKNKMNSGMRTGEYRMLRQDDDALGLVEGDIDDAATMLTFAKRLGWYTGGGKGGFTLAFGDVSEHYANGEEAVQGMYANREIYEALRIQLIVQNAMAQKMPEDFIDYLLGN
jgi:recombination protein RecA